MTAKTIVHRLLKFVKVVVRLVLPAVGVLTGILSTGSPVATWAEKALGAAVEALVRKMGTRRELVLADDTRSRVGVAILMAAPFGSLWWVTRAD